MKLYLCMRINTVDSLLGVLPSVRGFRYLQVPVAEDFLALPLVQIDITNPTRQKFTAAAITWVSKRLGILGVGINMMDMHIAFDVWGTLAFNAAQDTDLHFQRIAARLRTRQ